MIVIVGKVKLTLYCSVSLRSPERSKKCLLFVLTGVRIKRAKTTENIWLNFSLGQTKLSIISQCPYQAGVCKVGFHCNCNNLIIACISFEQATVSQAPNHSLQQNFANIKIQLSHSFTAALWISSVVFSWIEQQLTPKCTLYVQQTFARLW